MLQDQPPQFTRVAQYRQGYAVHQVDGLVSRIRAYVRSLQSEGPAAAAATGLTREDLDPAHLQAKSGGYRRDDVEKYLADASTMLAPSEQDRTDAVQGLCHPVFHRPKQGRPGYGSGSVDYLVGLIAQALRGEVEMTAQQLDEARPSEIRNPHDTWDRAEVDAYLTAVRNELTRRASGP